MTEFPPPPPPAPAQRCVPHGLGVGEDGLCIRCRRERALQGAPAAPGSSRLGWLMAALACTGALAYAANPRVREPAPAVEIAHAVEVEPAAPIPDEPSHETPLPPRPTHPAWVEPAAPVAPAAEAQVEPPVDEIKEAEAYVAAARAKREAEQHGRAVGNVQVVMYSTSWCGYCKRARAWLGGRGIAYTEHDIEQESAARDRMRIINPRGGVPTFEVDQLVLTGFSAGSLEQAIARAAEQRNSR